MKYRLVMFDFDGTLADSFAWFLSNVNALAGPYRFGPIEEAEIETLRGWDARKLLAHLGVPLWKAPIIARRLRTLMAKDVRCIRLFQGVDDLLGLLSESGATLAIVSSNSVANVQAVLGPANAARIAHYQCGLSMFGKCAGLRRVLGRSGIPREQAVYIGDEIRDLEAAKKAKVSSGCVAWGYARLDVLRGRGPTEVFATVPEIARLATASAEGREARLFGPDSGADRERPGVGSLLRNRPSGGGIAQVSSRIDSGAYKRWT
ncbi:MAG TPA: HAD hydrolase-like protein [Anaeromyxobacteraceae bacterium]|nr:HAD hydrolase-like protein [Anaeromyxobacteraceae bacterium]